MYTININILVLLLSQFTMLLRRSRSTTSARHTHYTLHTDGDVESCCDTEIHPIAMRQNWLYVAWWCSFDSCVHALTSDVVSSSSQPSQFELMTRCERRRRCIRSSRHMRVYRTRIALVLCELERKSSPQHASTNAVWCEHVAHCEAARCYASVYRLRDTRPNWWIT